MWIGSYTVTLGDWHIGVRVDDADARDFLIARLGDALQPSASPPPGYAVVTTVAGPKGVGRELPSLRVGQTSLFRSRSPLRLAQALVDHLHSHPDPPPGSLRLRTAAVVLGGSAALVPHSTLWAAGGERLLARLGISPIDSPVVDLDPNGRVRLPGRSSDGPVHGEPLKVSAWLIEGHLLGRLDPHSRSSLVAAASNLIVPTPSLDPQAALSGIERLLPVIEPVGSEFSIADVATPQEPHAGTG